MLKTSSGEKVKVRETITIYKNANQVTSAGDVITFQNSNSSNNSQKLKLENNAVKILKGVSKIKVSGDLVYNTSNTTRQWFQLQKNGSRINDIINYGTNNFITAAFTSKIIDVQENDLITLKLHNIEGTGTIDIGTGVDRASSYMTVEVVE